MQTCKLLLAVLHLQLQCKIVKLKLKWPMVIWVITVVMCWNVSGLVKLPELLLSCGWFVNGGLLTVCLCLCVSVYRPAHATELSYVWGEWSLWVCPETSSTMGPLLSTPPAVQPTWPRTRSHDSYWLHTHRKNTLTHTPWTPARFEW